jgi:NAD(P)H-dependent FMN reductase
VTIGRVGEGGDKRRFSRLVCALPRHFPRGAQEEEVVTGLGLPLPTADDSAEHDTSSADELQAVAPRRPAEQ